MFAARPILNCSIFQHFTAISSKPNSSRQFVEDVFNSLYVDNYASGKDSILDCFKQYQKLKKYFQEGGFNLRKRGSSIEELNEMIEREKEEESLLQQNSYSEQTLFKNVTLTLT